MLRRIRKFLQEHATAWRPSNSALIAPVLGTLLVGTIEVCNALECHQKVTMLASTAADLVAQATTVSTTDMTNIFDATTAIIYPFPQQHARSSSPASSATATATASRLERRQRNGHDRSHRQSR